MYYTPGDGQREYEEGLRFRMPNVPEEMSAYNTTLVVALGMKDPFSISPDPENPESQGWLLRDPSGATQREGITLQGTFFEEHVLQVLYEVDYIDLYVKKEGTGNMTVANVRSKVCFSEAPPPKDPDPPPTEINLENLNYRVTLPIITGK